MTEERFAEPAPDLDRDAVAVIGMSGRFPGAGDLDELWRNLRAGVESIASYSASDALAAGVSQERLRDPRLVKAGGELAGIELFDAGFFGLSPRQAEVLDPQHRLFLECAWQALEEAGYDPTTYPGLIGVYAGCGASQYVLRLLAGSAGAGHLDPLSVLIGNDKDYLASRVSFQLDLRGPSLSVQTACSTSLVAAHLARESLLGGEIDMALAGGVTVVVEPKRGYLYEEGGILSPDGRCRPFDARAAGTVFTSGAGVVVLKRLAEAVRDGDLIRAVIRGSAVNNDGAHKVGFTAPSVQGQREVIREALADAAVAPETVGYVETHGTATPLGDPIEIRALTQAFGDVEGRTGYCALGSVKSNIGHTDAAAGVAGLIKTVLALEHAELPPSLHFEEANPEIDFGTSPFYVNTELRPWETDGAPRRAGVSSFGLGGTNAHLVLEEAPELPASGASRPWQLLALSARSAAALDAQAARLAAWLEERPQANLADVAYTLWTGRRIFEHRRTLVCRDRVQAIAALARGPAAWPPGESTRRPVVFSFPGGGERTLEVARELYRSEAGFRNEVDRCCELVRAGSGRDVEQIVSGRADDTDEAGSRLSHFAAEYSLGRVWTDWGLDPEAAIGAGIGELAAACLSGELTIEHAAASLADGRRPELRPEAPAALCEDESRILLEIGSGRAAQPPQPRSGPAVFASLPEAGRPALPFMLDVLGGLWCAGAAIDRSRLYAHEQRRRLALPTYPFERRRYWIEMPGPGAGARGGEAGVPEPVSEGLYVPQWVAVPGPRPRDPADGPSRWLLFLDEGGLGEALAKRLRAAGKTVVTAEAGEFFSDLGGGAYRIDPAESGDYERLLGELGRSGPSDSSDPSDSSEVVVHLWGWGPEEGREALDRGFYSLLCLARARARQAQEQAPRLCLVASGLEKVLPGDRVWPLKATALGPVRVLPLEVPDLRATAVDVPHTESGADRAELAGKILAEVMNEAPEALVAYRGGERFARRFGALRSEPGAPRLRTGGVYLVTGGFGGLGATFAELLARRCGARLALLGRQADRRSVLVRRLEELGAEVLPLAADVADEEAMRRAITEIRSRFGALHGVVHAAGVLGGGAIHLRTNEEAAAVLRPKVEGTLALAAALGEAPLDFLVLCSSTAAVLGALGQADYAAANAFLDAFAVSASAPPGTISIGWDAWHETGMATPAADLAASPLFGGAAIRPEEGTAMLERVLRAAPGELRHVIASKRDFPALLERSRQLLGPSHAAEDASRPLAARHPRPEIAADFLAPRTELERKLAEIWEEVLGIERVGVNDLFFDLGGDSLTLMAVRNQLRRSLGVDVAMPRLFRFPTVAALAADLGRVEERPARPEAPRRERAAAAVEPAPSAAASDVAIVGMSGRFPGARNLDEFWRNLRDGVESISFFSDDELLAEGYSPEVLENPRFVKALPLLEGAEWFDAQHFGIHPREAETIDPQHRVFLETAWEALEDAGYDPATFPSPIAIFAGAGVSRYWINLVTNPKLFSSVGTLQLVIGNDKDYLPSRVAFKLDLKGPCVNVQSACSTSLIAVHLAARSLLAGDCGMALAGGVALAGPEKGGYLFEEGGMLAADGHCRAFDARASGTVFGSGSGVVVLRRLADALADGDTIHAVIRGSAVNNDGSAKVGYTAPGVDGQVRVMSQALAAAGLGPEAISYVEAHGTATQLGDPIEVAALAEVFGPDHGEKTCALGSVKSNIGHADAAAGVAGLLKTVLALKHRQLPPSLHFETPNPEIDFDSSPFYVNAALAPWPANGRPRRAGVSAFGVGGSNAHVVLEEAPPRPPSGPGRPWQLLLVSARTPTALDAATTNLARHLERHPDVPLADVAFTLQTGRRAMAHRRVLVCRDHAAAVAGLDGRPEEAVLGPFTGETGGRTPAVVFLFPGQGAQYVDMGRELYAGEEVFRHEVDRCAEILEPLLGCDLRKVLYPASRDDEDPAAVAEEAAGRLGQTCLTQPALFVIEYALARQWMSWGVRPAAMVGHSVGEYVAASLAGTFSLADALALVAARGRLMQSVAPGAMLSVPLSAAESELLLRQASPAGELALAATNAPLRSVVAGTIEAVRDLEALAGERGIETRRLATSHAFHSPMMDEVLEPFRRELLKVEIGEPRMPFVSNLTGDWISAGEARDPDYWVRHLRETVRFSRALETVCAGGDRVLLEVGPGRTLGSLARLSPAAQGLPVVYSMRHPREWASDQAYLAAALGRLWLAGCQVRWTELHAGGRRHRVPLPTYPFERQRYYVEPRELTGLKPRNVKKSDLADWFYVPVWKPADLIADELRSERHAPCLVFADDTGLADALAPRLEERLEPVIRVDQGAAFARSGAGLYTLDPRRRSDFEALLRELHETGRRPRLILFLWGVTADPWAETPAERERYLDEGIYALFHLAQLLEELGPEEPFHLVVVSTGVHAVDGSETLVPEKATLIGPTTVIPQEYRHVSCHAIDLVPAAAWERQEELLDRLLEELVNDRPETAIAYRRDRRWVQSWEPVRIEPRRKSKPRFREQGCYLITGGLGGLGLTFARHLAAAARARLVLTGRSALPSRGDWAAWLGQHPEDDATSAKIRRLEELEALGAEVMAAAVDVADPEGMKGLVAAVRQRFGPLHGVLHAAGLPSGGLLQNKARETIAETLLPKVQGTRVLEAVLAGEELDFFVLFSSSGAILGGLGYYDYCAANAFLDAFAHARTARGHLTHSINWGAWKETGMAVVSNMGFTSDEEHQAFLRRGITSAEGLEVFHRVLDRRIPQVSVWPLDLQASIAAARLLAVADEAGDEEAVAAHPRPALASDYVAPRDEIENGLAEIWQDLLGIDRVGVRDNFFELGADSLLATQMISRARRQLGVGIAHHKLFETPTIEDVARWIRGQESREELDEIEALLSEVEEMSDHEIEE